MKKIVSFYPMLNAGWLISMLPFGEPTSAGDRATKYYLFAKEVFPGNAMVNVALIEEKSGLPESDWCYTLQVIDETNGKNCQSISTRHLSEKELEALLSELKSTIEGDNEKFSVQEGGGVDASCSTISAEDAIGQLEVALARHRHETDQFHCFPTDWIPQTTAALSLAIQLLREEAQGLLLHAELPIGTQIYRLRKRYIGKSVTINGEQYIHKTAEWYVTSETYDWLNAIYDSRKEEDGISKRYYYLSKEDALKVRDQLNAELAKK